MSKSTEKTILRETLEAVIKHPEIGNDCYPLVGFASVNGSNWSHDLMVVGRFVNGWDDKYTREELRSAAQQDEFLEKILGLEPLEALRRTNTWLSRSSKRSAFWLTVGDVARSEEFKLGQDWDSKLVYSNLYRFGPDGRNPPVSLRGVQQPGCRRLLADEIESRAPRRILLLTGWKGWAERFLGTKDIPFIQMELRDGNVELVGTISVGSTTARVVVSKHPARKPRDPIVKEIREAFGELQSRA
ncbi:MAG: hypothetical protein ABSE21_09305 [Bryobacteraceae bacterium]